MGWFFKVLWCVLSAGGPSSQELAPQEDKALAVFELRMEEHNKLQASPYVDTIACYPHKLGMGALMSKFNF